jgi:hypothetical protein
MVDRSFAALQSAVPPVAPSYFAFYTAFTGFGGSTSFCAAVLGASFFYRG